MLITKDYKNLNSKLHESNKAYGVSGKKWAIQISELASVLNTRDVLDYGCGKSTLANNMPFKIHQYDPAIEKYTELPKPADIVVCTDVLEHVEPECLDNVLEHLKSLVNKVGFFTIATRPAKKVLADGRNAHLIQENYRWWLNKLLNNFDIQNFNTNSSEIVVFVTQLNLKGKENA